MSNLRGSNQHKTKYRIVSTSTWASVWFIAFITLAISVILYQQKQAFLRSVTSPCPVGGCVVRVAQAAEPTPTPAPPPTTANIVAYIAKKFEPEGKAVVVKAINCFYSESGLRAEAVGQNNDGPRSKDHGVAQLNDYWHKLTDREKTDYIANIDRAYKIYKGRGNSFEAWYGRLCN